MLFGIDRLVSETLKDEFAIQSTLPREELTRQLRNFFENSAGRITAIFDEYDGRLDASPIGSTALIKGVTNRGWVKLAGLDNVKKVVPVHGVDRPRF